MKIILKDKIGGSVEIKDGELIVQTDNEEVRDKIYELAKGGVLTYRSGEMIEDSDGVTFIETIEEVDIKEDPDLFLRVLCDALWSVGIKNKIELP